MAYALGYNYSVFMYIIMCVYALIAFWCEHNEDMDLLSTSAWTGQCVWQQALELLWVYLRAGEKTTVGL